MANRLALEGRKILVAGGSEGIGLAVARLAAEAGARVHIASRSETKLAAARAKFETVGISVVTRQVDGSDESSVRTLFDTVGDLDHLAILAGGPVMPTAFLELTPRDVEAAIRAKLMAQWTIARFGAPKLRAGGSITLTAGSASRRFSTGLTWLSMINAAIEALGKSLAAELTMLNIRVNVVTPGITDTPLWSRLPADKRTGLLEGAAQRLPVGFVAEAEDIAATFIHLMTNRYVTGAVFDVDGGALVS